MAVRADFVAARFAVGSVNANAKAGVAEQSNQAGGKVGGALVCFFGGAVEGNFYSRQRFSGVHRCEFKIHVPVKFPAMAVAPGHLDPGAHGQA